MSESSPTRARPMRRWSTPLALGAVLLAGGTGLALFLEFGSGTVKELHEWAGLLFVAAAIAHLVDHRRSLVHHVQGVWGLGLGGLGLLVLVVALVLPQAPGGASPRAMAGLLARVPLSQLASAQGVPFDSLRARLERAGFPGATATSTLAELPGADGERMRAAVGAVLPAEPEGDED